MITYNLTLNKLRKRVVNDFTDVVYEVEYFCRAYSEEYRQCSYSMSGSIFFDVDEYNPEEFIPFEDITKEDVLQWIIEKKEAQNIEEVDFVKYSLEQVQNQVDYLLSETEVQLSDWTFTNKEPEPETETN